MASKKYRRARALIAAAQQAGTSVGDKELLKARQAALLRMQKRSARKRADNLGTNPAKRIETFPAPLTDLTGKARRRATFVPKGDT